MSIAIKDWNGKCPCKSCQESGLARVGAAGLSVRKGKTPRERRLAQLARRHRPRRR